MMQGVCCPLGKKPSAAFGGDNIPFLFCSVPPTGQSVAPDRPEGLYSILLPQVLTSCRT